MEYYKSMEFYTYLKKFGIPILSQQEFYWYFGNLQEIDYIIQTPTTIIAFKMAFKLSFMDHISANDTLKFVEATYNLSKSSGVKCMGYFIGNVKLSDKAYEIYKNAKHCDDDLYISFCCDSDQNKLNQKIIKMLYSNHIYLYDSDGDSIMIHE